MGLCAWSMAGLFAGALAAPGLRFAALALLIVASTLIYFAAASAFGAVRLPELRALMRRAPRA
jgi:putative peptidoglycan lipid II flippase